MKKIISIILAIAILSMFLSGCTEEEKEQISYMDLTAAEAKDLIDNNPDLIIIDVSPAYDDGHLPGAMNYYIGDGSLDDAIPMLDKNKTYLVYCHTDSASMQGAQALIDAGFENVYRLEGNYQAWVDAGYDIETPEPEITYMDVNASEAYDLINTTEDLIIIDVSPNYDDGHLPGAVNYYVGDGSLDEAIPTLDMNATFLVYCHTDSASMQGAQALIDAGFENVYRLEGNYQAWVDAGYDIET